MNIKGLSNCYPTKCFSDEKLTNVASATEAKSLDCYSRDLNSLDFCFWSKQSLTWVHVKFSKKKSKVNCIKSNNIKKIRETKRLEERKKEEEELLNTRRKLKDS